MELTTNTIHLHNLTLSENTHHCRCLGFVFFGRVVMMFLLHYAPYLPQFYILVIVHVIFVHINGAFIVH